jgi:hypothetical protein
MTFNHMRPGLFNVGSYQISGKPWITGSNGLAPGVEDRIVFPRVARSVTVINTDPVLSDDLRVHFNSTSSAGQVINGLHFVQLNNNNDAISFGVKCNEIFISAPAANAGNAAYTVIAELTDIEPSLAPTLTGSGLTQ